ncbi:hypothetical protein [Peteryoungia algae]|uniref:Uncharacterized protein n=1 Tax=Peteryoungia algae TaxID=2919917 RepID=A0ABT0CXC2_9HYPH|nr:hypothetical protein [Rhizobium sp. SSM4.3]MCJ8237819.1 hypothetical protein [Rhizobium sp. SSM4.3]
MKREIVDQLMADFPFYADLRLLVLPDGWTDIVSDLFRDLYDLQKLSPGFMDCDLPIQIVAITWHLYPSTGYVIYARPLAHHRHWTGEMALRLVQIVSRFNDRSRHTCEVCGDQSVGTLKYQDHRRQELLCQTHMEERRWS